MQTESRETAKKEKFTFIHNTPNFIHTSTRREKDLVLAKAKPAHRSSEDTFIHSIPEPCWCSVHVADPHARHADDNESSQVRFIAAQSGRQSFLAQLSGP